MPATFTRRRPSTEHRPEQVAEPAPFDLVVFLWGRRKLIMGITLLGLAAGVAAAYIITPLYRSEVILFPAITNSVSKALLTEQSTGRDDILALGDEEDSEQLLQMLHSRPDPRPRGEPLRPDAPCIASSPSKHRNSELREAYKDHITFEHTKFSSVRVEVNDPEPQRAADIANFIADQVDSVWNDMARERAEKGYHGALKVEQLERDITQMAGQHAVLR
jgi:hypothetical protein